MSLTHCPLCIGLAVLSVLRAACHIGLLALQIRPQPQLGPAVDRSLAL